MRVKYCAFSGAKEDSYRNTKIQELDTGQS